MKKLLLILILAFAFGKGQAQSIPNGGFENWTTATWIDPVNYSTSNEQAVFQTQAKMPNVVRVDGWQHNVNFGAQLTTTAEGFPGYITNSIDNPLQGKGGIPYNQKPTGVEMWYNCNIMPGDTAVWGVIFKKNGIIVGGGLFPITGTVTGYPLKTEALTLLVTPDTVIFAAISSKSILKNEPGYAGSTFTISGVTFTGGSVSQPALLNGDFINWTSPDSALTGVQGWNVLSGTLFRTEQSHSGTYAMYLPTLPENGGAQPTIVSTGGVNTTNGPIFLQPYNQQNDTLQFYYNLFPSPTNLDSAGVILQFKVGATAPGYAYILSPTSGYQLVKLPINLSAPADSAIITFSSYYTASLTGRVTVLDTGAALLVDDIQFLSQGVVTGVKPLLLADNTLLIYPNPANGQFTVSSTQSAINEVRMENILGETVLDNHFTAGSASAKQNIDVSHLTPGEYFISITSGNKTSTGKITVN